MHLAIGGGVTKIFENVQNDLKKITKIWKMGKNISQKTFYVLYLSQSNHISVKYCAMNFCGPNKSKVDVM